MRTYIKQLMCYLFYIHKWEMISDPMSSTPPIFKCKKCGKIEGL